MVRHFQIRTWTDPNDGLPVYECFRFNQFSSHRAGAHEGTSGWVEGYEPDATNGADGTPIGTPDADLAAVADGSDPVLVSDADGAAVLEEGVGPEPEGETYTTTPTWP